MTYGEALGVLFILGGTAGLFGLFWWRCRR